MKRPNRFALVAILLLGSLTARAADKPGNSTDFTAKRAAQFSAWQTARKLGDHPGDVWDCAACPVLKVLPSGGIYIGSADWEPDRETNEGPLADVKIPANIAVGRYEVTRGEFAAFATATHRRPHGKCQAAGSKATFLDPGFAQSDDHPVVCVSFEDARAYVAWLNTQSDGGYRLLTEAEWEFATRTATHTKYAWGNEAEFACLYANNGDDSNLCEDPWPRTAPVGSSAINGFDLYDLSGNASEWVDGCFVAARQPATLDAKCALHIEKGGSWKSAVRELRPARRTGHEAKYREDSLGFRVAKNLPDGAAPLTSAADYQRRARMLGSIQAYAEARADFERALALEPRNALMLAESAETSYWLGDMPRCQKDVSAALALDADEPLAVTLQAAMRRVAGPDAKTGLEPLERAAKRAPWRPFTQAELAVARYASGDVEGALASSAAALTLAPRYQPVFELRLHILAERRNWRALYIEARQMLIANYFNDQIHADAARAYNKLGIPEAAVWAMNRAIGIRPSASYYLQRETVRLREDLEGRRADLVEALKIEPGSSPALYQLARLESDAGNHAAAASAFTKVIETDSMPKRIAQMRLLRGIEYAQSANRPLAEKDFAAWLDPPNDAGKLNEMCWYLTVAGVELERAQRSCKRALELKPRNGAYLDSQGWLLLRLERFDDAIAAFDAALTERPDQAASLFGRGLARQQKCGCREGGKDLLAALAADPASVQKYAFTGYTPRGELIAPWMSVDSKRDVAPAPR